jgi:DNA replication licensing factor MCM2
MDDEEEYGHMTEDERRAAEEMMRRRNDDFDDDEERSQTYINSQINVQEDDEDDGVVEDIEDDDNDDPHAAVMHMIGNEDEDDDEDEDEDDEDDETFLSSNKGNKKEWFALEKTQRKIRKKMMNFLEGCNGKYEERIRQMSEQNKCSIDVEFADLVMNDVVLSSMLTELPDEMLYVFDEVALRVVLKLFPFYSRIHKQIHIRIYGLPIADSLKDLRHTHLNQLIKVVGVVTRRTAVYPQLKLIKFDCSKCSAQIGPIIVRDSNKLPKPTACPQCQGRGPFTINQNHTVYRNYQKITLQEAPGSVSAGRIPRSKDVILLHDLIDSCRPGEEIELTGIYKHSFDAFLNIKQGFPVFSTVIEANHVTKRHDKIGTMITEEDKRMFHKISQSPDLKQRIMASIAPSIYGHDDIKIGLALALFGGRRKEKPTHRVRGDINVLLVGDPGTAKSQFLKYVEKTSNRAVYTTGKGSTAVGLTASVRKDPLTGEWTLEGGALVLADNGTCLIDEFDKMSDQDRTSIHEAMEQQTISISKAGIVTTLTARCSIIAAANPVQGRYNSSRTFQQNVDLTEPILSRFDVLCVVRDTVDPVVDERLAKFVVQSHSKSHPLARKRKRVETNAANKRRRSTENGQEEIVDEEEEEESDEIQHLNTESAESIPQELFKKYLLYAKKNYHPELSNVDSDRIVKFYVNLRKESTMGGGIPIAVRHLESTIRMAEASAKMHLRDHVTDDDTNTAISVMLESFIATQKYSVQRGLKAKFQKYLLSPNNNHQVLLHLLDDVFRDIASTMDDEEDLVVINIDMLKNKARSVNIYDIQSFLKDTNLLSQHKYKWVDPEGDGEKLLVKRKPAAIVRE